MLREETLLVPLKFIFVAKDIYTYLDVLQEKGIDEYWNVEANRSSSDSWKRFTKFSFIERETPKGKHHPGERLTKIQATTRPEILCEVWSMGEAIWMCCKRRIDAGQVVGFPRQVVNRRVE